MLIFKHIKAQDQEQISFVLLAEEDHQPLKSMLKTNAKLVTKKLKNMWMEKTPNSIISKEYLLIFNNNNISNHNKWWLFNNKHHYLKCWIIISEVIHQINIKMMKCIIIINKKQKKLKIEMSSKIIYTKKKLTKI